MIFSFVEVNLMQSIKGAVLKTIRYACLIVLPFLFMLPFVGKGQQPSLKTLVNKQEIVIGELLQYKVEATFPLNTYTLKWFTIPDSIAHFEVVERSKIDSIQANNIITLSQIISLTSFDSGLQTIPAFEINFYPIRNDPTVNLLTDSVRIMVSFSQLDSIKPFHDIKTIIEVKDEWPLWVWIAAALSLLLLIFLIYYFIKNIRKKKPKKLFVSKLSPLDEAIQSLDELQGQQLLIKGEIKQFHTQLGEIFKRYISRKTNTNLLTLTSDEVLIKLEELNIKKQEIGLMANNLKMGDAVKFAKYIPANSDSETALENTKKVIQQIDQFIKSGI